jgi:hypothetical protein
MTQAQEVSNFLEPEFEDEELVEMPSLEHRAIASYTCTD